MSKLTKEEIKTEIEELEKTATKVPQKYSGRLLMKAAGLKMRLFSMNKNR